MKPQIKILLIPTITIFILLGFAVPVNMVGNWYQQFMPNIGGRNITDIFFLDSLTGWAVTNATNQNNDTTYLLMTTTSGDNWIIQYRKVQTGGGFPGYYRVYFLNQNTGYVCGVTGIDKSTNGGSNWESLNAPFNSYLDISVVSEQDIWIVSSNPLTGGIFFTSNGGSNWTQQYSGSNNPAHIYMYNARIGFADGPGLLKTTNGGSSWILIPGAGNFLDMFFIDSLTGWKSNLDMKKTTNGGLNWVTQTLPQGGNILISQIIKFDNIVRDTIWGVGSTIMTGSGNRGTILRTTNGGTNWLFQIPDSNISIFQYQHVQFTKPLIGWAYTGIRGVHTVLGGDPIWLTGIKKLSNEVPRQFMLYQNYPNPFNPRTVIRYTVKSETSNVKLIIYDIQGKEIITLVNQKQSPGIYEVDFSGKDYSSGVYFYSLIIDNKLIDTKRMILVK